MERQGGWGQGDGGQRGGVRANKRGPRGGGAKRGRGGQKRRQVHQGGRDGHQERIIQPVSAKVLEEKMHECDPQDLLLWLTADRAVDMLLRRRAPEDKSRRWLFAAVRKACRSERSETPNHLLVSIGKSAIFQGLPEYLSRVHIPSMSECNDNTGSPAMDQEMRILTELVEDLVEVLGHLITSRSKDTASSFSQLLLALQNRIIPDLQLDRLKPDMTNIKDMVEKTIRTEADDSERSSDVPCENGDEDKPSDDFRQMNILPNQDDMNNFNPHLNKIDEEFRDLETYLDTQFRLIREDFIRPLREDIREYKENGRRAPTKVYYGVRILLRDMTLQVWLSSTSS